MIEFCIIISQLHYIQNVDVILPKRDLFPDQLRYTLGNIIFDVKYVRFGSQETFCAVLMRLGSSETMRTFEHTFHLRETDEQTVGEGMDREGK